MWLLKFLALYVVLAVIVIGVFIAFDLKWTRDFTAREWWNNRPTKEDPDRFERFMESVRARRRMGF